MDDIQEALRKRYPRLHPLLFQRSVEKARSHGELFDILETVPDQFPLIWDEKLRRWVVTDDLMQAKTVSEVKRKE